MMQMMQMPQGGFNPHLQMQPNINFNNDNNNNNNNNNMGNNMNINTNNNISNNHVNNMPKSPPICSFYRRGHCQNPRCRYLHEGPIDVQPPSPSNSNSTQGHPLSPTFTGPDAHDKELTER